MAVKRRRGFTLLEVMVVVAIVGILAAVALPAYQNQVRKGNRSAAQQFMMDVATKEQQILMDMRSYVSVADGNFGNKPADSPPGVGLAQPTTTSGLYQFSVAATNPNNAPPTFTITATAIGTQSPDGNLTLDQSGTKTGNW